MHYRTLGNSGAVVSSYALGTMTFGAEADEVTSHAILDDYVAGGGNFIDTADVYGTGVSEEIIGHWLAAHPTDSEQVVIATKGRFSKGGGPNDLGTSRRHLGRALDSSLRPSPIVKRPFEAITTCALSVGCAASQRPMISSEAPLPYTSAVSMRLPPAAT